MTSAAPDWGTTTLPWCSFSVDDGPRRVGVGVGRSVLDAGAALPWLADEVADGTLDALLAHGPDRRDQVRRAVADLVGTQTDDLPLVPADDVTLYLPWTVRDYVDFYASEHHAAAVGRLFRPGTDPLPAAWKHLPIGYHGRAGSVVVSGTDVRRPGGQRREPDGAVTFGPSTRLDLEAEVGFVVGGPATRGPLTLAEAEDRLFGVVLVNDWSARDLQAWEYVPLGPFLGKSFATSVSAWVVPMEALRHARTAPPPRDVPLLPYLDDTSAPAGALDLALEVRIGDEVVSRPPYRAMYWTPAQMLAHSCVNGAAVRPGDLFASGTVSGPARGESGALIELTANGAEPIVLGDGSTRAFLHDGDEVTVSATAPGPAGRRVPLGEVRGRVVAGS
ncbi:MULTISPECIES: fumarylacetoacetate hydrolase family protein [unclassified Aeromicrobium]|jgi:fumarylacetoacetase|uniref:fumarylacetoacetate hydrolase family protein n=2 Tax=Aeromicrobium TaxID=2040 RepID=UPI000AA991F6|nr:MULTISPECIES: fumarylacetoacetate hydrolase family protein [unclassified Aeromicrobium]